jgi:MFS transporter, CP family, cyanate transporter
LTAAIVLVAFNLRPTLASVGPLVGAIQQDTGLSHVLIGLLTTLPLLAFGFVSALTPLVTKRIGIGRALSLGLSLLCAGAAMRTASQPFYSVEPCFWAWASRWATCSCRLS